MAKDRTDFRPSALYSSAMQRHPLLDSAGEQALAARIEQRSYALWTTLLSHRASAPIVARIVGERLPAARPLFERGARARAAAELHALDVDHLVADVLVAEIAAWARDPATAPADLRGGAGSRAFVRHAAAVAEAAREVAEARNCFVQANLGLVLHVANRYRSRSLSYSDFVQEGMLGLIKAVDRFDHRRGLRFSTYGTWWIRHAMGRALADKDRLVRVPVHMQEARQRLATLHRSLGAELGREPSREELAAASEIPTEKIDRILESAAAFDVSLDAPVGNDEDRSLADIFLDPGETAADPEQVLELQGLAGEVRRCMERLSPIEREVLQRRFGLDGGDDEQTLREIASDHGLSRERIRQIESNALGKLRTRLARVDVDRYERAA